MQPDELRRILLDRNLAQLGDSLLNFTLSAALTRLHGQPTGRRVRNELMTTIIDQSSLKTILPTRTSRRNRANAFEALAGYLWLKGNLSTDDLIELMVKTPSDDSVGVDPELEMLRSAFELLVNRLATQTT